MSIAQTVARACTSQHCDYEVWSHKHTAHSLGTAHRAHVPPAQLAKAVALYDEEGPLLAVIPADRQLNTSRLNDLMHRHFFFMNEHELEELFPDCEPGAIPPAGGAYNVRTITDSRLLSAPEVWFEGGDHESLVHMHGESFRRLMQNSQTATIS